VAEFGVGVGDFNWHVGGVVGHALVVHPFSLGAFLQHPLSCCIVLCFLGLLFEDYHQLLHRLSCHVGWRYDSCNCACQVISCSDECVSGGDCGHCQVLVFEEDCVADLRVARVGDIDLVAPIMIPRITNVEPASRVGSP
jgi:hypothetical protein